MEGRSEKTGMGIQMIGIDHSLAEIEVREKFSFTGKQAAALMEEWKEENRAQGIVLLSTCNRMEIYVNNEEEDVDYCGLVCEAKGLDRTVYGPFFRVRSGRDAVQHLFEMTAGMHSLILGEDQILTQVKEALSFAREQYAADKVLEVLFRQAITTAKEVKTKAPLSGRDLSAAAEAVRQLKNQGRTFEGKKCLVIGNGLMGRLAAQALLEEGADVAVTVRQYHRGIVDIPAGAKRIDYGNRYEVLPDCDYVFSATASPNLTVTREGLEQCGLHKEQIFVDLAVPRDMEEAVREYPTVTLYDVDDFSLREVPPQMREGFERAALLVQEGVETFQSRYECRELIPRVQRLSRLAAEDLCGRLEKPFKQTEKKQRETLLRAVESSADKVTARLLFALRDELDAEGFRECLDILERKFGP